MELDELKYQLKSKLAVDHAGRSDEDIAALLNRKTISITTRLKKNLWFEIIFGTAAIIVLALISILTSRLSISIYFAVFSVLLAVFMVILIYLLRRITKLSHTNLPVKSNLQTIVRITEEFMKRYFQFTMALIPVCFIFAFVLISYEDKRIPAFEHLSRSKFTTSWKVIAFLVVYLIALNVGVWYFTKWYLQKLYGKYVVRLKECMAELGE